MCGIAGLVFFKKHGNQAQILKNMGNTIKHRGPNDEGYVIVHNQSITELIGDETSTEYTEKLKQSQRHPQSIDHFQSSDWNIGLVHRRLSILDLSPNGHQPFGTPDQKIWLVFNGEIYNYLDIKKELLNDGFEFRTETDTEVVLYAYKKWGAKFVNKLVGMWALVIFNQETNEIFASRDRYGVKPFYYIHNHEYFAFCSEQKGLLSLPFFNTYINHEAAYEYLVLGTTESKAQGLFQNIIELMPSNNLSFNTNDGKITIQKYHQLSYNDTWEAFDPQIFEKHVQKTRELLIESVDFRLQSDVSLGSCLSGGIDSSSIAGITHQLMKNKTYGQIGQSLKVFTASFPQYSNIDESHWAKEVVNHTQSQWYQSTMKIDDFLNEITKITYTQDIPILTASTVSQYFVMKLIQSHQVKVSLDGQGADELFGGYQPHLASFMCEKLHHQFHLNWQELQHLKSNSTFPLKHIFANLFGNYISSKGFKNTRKEFSLINQEFWSKYQSRLSELKNKFSFQLNHLLYQQYTGEGLKVLLRTGDRNSMNFSVESRVPFADHYPLIDYVFQIPSVYKIKNNQNKYLLREAMKPFLPTKIYQRKDKLGFVAPDKIWLQHSKNLFQNNLTQGLDDFYDSKMLLKNWDYLLSNTPSQATNRIYRMIQFAIWKKTFGL
jgi:asparagine synthase (glutamine-hydrolysing)